MYIKLPRFASAAIYTALGLAAAFLAARYLLPWLSPFIAAFVIAALMESPVKFLSSHLRIPRAAASGMCTAVMLSLAVALISLLLGKAAAELSSLSSPEIISQISGAIGRFNLSVRDLAENMPGELREYVLALLDSLPAEIASLMGSLSGKLLSMVSSLAGSTPEVLLYAFTCGIGIYFISSEYTAIMRFFKLQIPGRYRDRAELVRADVLRSIAMWLRAQFIMMLITFCELVIALSLMRVKFSIMLAMGVSIIDAMPILGTGTVLLPWALFEMVTGDFDMAIGLALTYGVVTLVRNIIQAKLVGNQLGLHPVVTLAAIYVGFSAMGFLGMILFPIAVITLKQMNDRGIVRLWRREEQAQG